MSAVPQRLVTALADRYRIEREIGSGGMATVYLAHDVKHDRRVALKVLRPELAAVIGAERFLTEIKTTANLQHPHILALFDSGQVDGTVFYVMPYVEGESLRDRLAREKQLPVPDAIRIATEVASALDYAHRHDVIHRDIKPENILLHDGRALVADFGIALAASRTEGGSRMTETGMSLGTPHYMSPEQAMGERSLDARTDVYALGCVLYEMLTAEPPFTGATAQAIMARVMTEEPRSLTMQRRTVPPHVEAAVRTALEKLPADRFETAALFAAALADRSYAAASPALGGAIGATGTGATGAIGAAAATAAAVPETRALSLWRRAGTPLAGVAALVGFGLFVRERLRPLPEPAPVARFALVLAPDVITTLTGQVIALSLDGSRMVYVAANATGTQLFARTLDNVVPVPMAGTNSALSPFFSPDGQHIAFVTGEKLVKIAVAGGPPLPIADVNGAFLGGTWSEGDSILFADDRGLSVVSASGGAPRLLVAPDSGSTESYRWPEFLPKGRSAVFSIFDGNVDRLAILTLDGKPVERTDVLGANPRFVRQGYLVLALITTMGGTVGSGTLVSVPFDAERLQVRGASVPVVEGAQVGATTRTAKMGVSRSGTVAFAVGDVGRMTLVAVGRNGGVRDLGAPVQFYVAPRLSPDGKRVAVQVTESGNDIWVLDLAPKTLTRLTFDRSGTRPIWTPDGRRVVYQRRGSGSEDLAWIPADGSAPAESLVVGPGDQAPGDFTPDGRTMVIREFSAGLRRSLSLVALDSARAPKELLKNTFENHTPSLAPDGRWVAYASDESGRDEVYVRPFPGPGGRWQVSTGGGTEPLWSPTGREIFFRAGQRIMSAAVQTGASFTRGEVRELFVTTSLVTPFYRNYDVTRDGQTFIMAQPTGATDQTVVLLLNWFDNLRARSPR